MTSTIAERGQQPNTGTQESDMAIHDHTPASRQLKNIIIPSYCLILLTMRMFLLRLSSSLLLQFLHVTIMILDFLLIRGDAGFSSASQVFIPLRLSLLLCFQLLLLFGFEFFRGAVLVLFDGAGEGGAEEAEGGCWA